MDKPNCCATCDYWERKYQKCDNPEQRQSEADAYMSPPGKSCWLWEPKGEEDDD